LQAEKERIGLRKILRRPDPEEIKAIKKFLYSIGLMPEKAPIRWSEIYVLDIENAPYLEVLEIPRDLINLVKDYNQFYTGGLYLGLLYKRKSGSLGFKPSLPLARRISSLCKTVLKCFVLNDKGEKIFLYGKEVPIDLILKLSDRKISVVINIRGEPLGWGRLEIKGGSRKLVPVVDLGWYLRRGG
jgi:ribosome biogenesis protein Nip4